MTEPHVEKPHRLTIEVTQWGEMQFAIECPYDGFHAERECRMGLEPTERCEPWEDGDDCPEGGFMAGDVGHVHPTNGCWVIWSMNEWGISWSEAIKWVGDFPEQVTLPLDVWVSPSADDVHEIGLWPLAEEVTSDV